MQLPRDPFRPQDPRADAIRALVPALVLTGLGLICVFSFGAEHLLRQAVWATLGVAACLLVAHAPHAWLRRAAVPSLAVVAALLVVALLFAPTISGTKRWLVLPGIAHLQPSEFAKLAVVLYLAHRLARERDLDGRVLEVVWPVVAVGALVVAAPDLGTTIFIAAVAAVLVLVAGARIGPVVMGVAAAIPVLVAVTARYPYMQKRLEFFVRGELSYQQAQALVALGSGGLMGNGLGAGRQKMDYLPAGHTDFALANIGEELGFLGVALVGLLFGLICVHGVRVALAAARRRDAFCFHLACGATFVVTFQAAVNIAVATAAAPTKGISLPFLSQGGSNLLVSLLAIGCVVHVGRHLGASK